MVEQITRTRKQWGATAPLGPAMRLPATTVYVHHSVTLATDHDEFLESTDDPDADMRRIERVGIERFGRFSYSFAYHPSGVELVGAGLTVGAHTGGYNSTTLGLVLIGNYSLYAPTGPQLVAMARRIRKLREDGSLAPRCPIYPHQRVKQTECPGKFMVPKLDTLRGLANHAQEEDHTMHAYEYLALVTLTEPATIRTGGTIPPGSHVFHVDGNSAVHIGPDGVKWAKEERHLAEVTITNARGFLDAHSVEWGNV